MLFVRDQSQQYRDSLLGVRLMPNSRSLQAREGYFFSKVDGLGFNNDTISMKKTDKLRILSLGDSYTEAYQVQRSNNYSSILQRILNKDGDKYEVFNLGVQKKSVPDYIGLSKNYVDIFSPDLVIIKIDNDDFTNDALRNDHEYFLDFSDGKYEIKEGIPIDNTLSRKIYNKLGWLQPILFLVNVQLESIMSEGKNESDKQSDIIEKQYNNMIAWQMKKLKESFSKVPVVLIYIADTSIIEGDSILEKNEEIKKIIKENATANSMPIINTTYAFSQFFEQNKQFPKGFSSDKPGQGHLNNYGHEIVAKLLAGYIVSTKIIKIK